MFRLVLKEFAAFSNGATKFFARRNIAVSAAVQSHHVEADEDYVRRYTEYFDKEDIDHWEIRTGMNKLAQDDGVPDPEIIIAALKAARRLNDYALTIRLLETVQMKCGPKKKVIWPYILSEIGPTLQELGVETPEELGYDKPELWCEGTD